MALGLVGTQSPDPYLSDQRRVLDDFVAIPGWRSDGFTWISNAPRGLAYLFHYLHGAFALDLRKPETALRFAQAPLAVSSENSSPQPIWSVRDVTRAPELFGKDSSLAWDYLVKLPEKFPVVGELFGMRNDFELALASYSMMLLLIEAVTKSEELLEVEEAKRVEAIWFTVPPMFFGSANEVLQVASARVFGDRELVKLVADSVGEDLTPLAEAWPYWAKAISRFGWNVFKEYRFEMVEPPWHELAI